MKEVNTRHTIHIKGARSNNLKNIELLIPKKKLVVVTGVSGSGKSSLIMDTLYAEGQRRYVESLSSYARQFLNRMKKPDIDFIKGIAPAIAIEQKVTTGNNRSTVGSMTEIYDYMRLLYSRVGRTYSPNTGALVKKHQVSDVTDFIFENDGKRAQLFAKMVKRYHDRTLKKQLELLLQKGYTRVQQAGKLIYIEELLESKKDLLNKSLGETADAFKILIDRFSINDEKENRKRIADSVNTAFYEGEGECAIEIIEGETRSYNNRFELDGISFLEPTNQLFNYNNPYGACPKCEGYGKVLGIDSKKIIPDESISVFDGAVACWRGEKNSFFQKKLINTAYNFNFPVTKPIEDLNEEERDLLWKGNEYFSGINDFFKELEQKTYKIQNRVMLARYRGRTVCGECKGGRLRKEATYVKVADKSITELINLPIENLRDFFVSIILDDYQSKVANRLLVEINARLDVMCDIGLGYLTLDRISNTLSGGETQRINITRTLGSNLTSSLYILDEPSIGLHPKDTNKLVEVLKGLRDLGNTVIVVEHEEEIIRSADHIIDIGPKAGINGGHIVFNGSFKKLMSLKNCLTKQYLTGEKKVGLDRIKRERFTNKIEIIGAKQHNLKNINVSIPLNAITVVSGVSGSGKTTLVKKILYPALQHAIGGFSTTKLGLYKDLSGDLTLIKTVEMISQSPIGKSSRSNPATYTKAYDGIRKLMAAQQASKIKGYEAKHFSFNVDAGRCENCKGEGEITIEMQFLADVKLQCEDCKGQRFKQVVLDVKYKNKNIHDILEMSIEEALDFYSDQKEIIKRIKPLNDVGLGYVKLGQSSSTLSGGEAQRVKLASFLIMERKAPHTFFIFDEPTTGLHFDDINKLLSAMNQLVESGHTVLIVEHNLDVIRAADWVIDLGPLGGEKGGDLLFQGKASDLTKVKGSYTGKFLKEKN
ncbi:MAG: excinuclease ABC subunit UvrA [Saprospiraceae bacterium]